MQRYFVNSDAISLPNIYITGDDCHHIGLVMRMKPGDKVYVSDQERSFIAEIVPLLELCQAHPCTSNLSWIFSAPDLESAIYLNTLAPDVSILPVYLIFLYTEM